MPDNDDESDELDGEDFDDVEWELCSSAREAAVFLLPPPGTFPIAPGHRRGERLTGEGPVS